MTVRKLSISVPAEVEETIKAAAADEGKPVSAWLAEAATEKARAAALHAAGRAAARELIAEYEHEHGPLPAESRQAGPGIPHRVGPARRRAAAGRQLMAAIVYDTGALLAADRRNPDFLALHDEVTAARIRPLVPVVVLAQAWRGGPQHQISRVLKGCDIIPDDERTGRAAGIACAAAGTTDVVDAISSPPLSGTRPRWSPATPATSPESPTPSASRSSSTPPDQPGTKTRSQAPTTGRPAPITARDGRRGQLTRQAFKPAISSHPV